MKLKIFLNLLLLLLMVSVIGISCKNTPQNEEAEATATTETFEKPRVPEWHKNATIYEVNMRHYTPEGTFKAFESHIPRL